MTTTTELLRQDHNAAPAPYRAADFGGRAGQLVVTEGLASDRYSLIPATSVTLGKCPTGSTAADLEPGVYEVPKLDAAPTRVGDAPNAAKLIPTGRRVELRPFLVEGVGHVHTVTRDLATGAVVIVAAIFEPIQPGVRVALDVRPVADRRCLA